MTIIVISLLSIHTVLQVWHYQVEEVSWTYRQLFDVDEEDCVPTWYSSMALFLTSMILLVISGRKRDDQDPWIFYWYGLTIAFAFLSLDEIAGFHETLNSMIDMSWAIPGGIAAGIFGLLYLRFLWNLPSQTRWLFIIAGGIFVGGAVGVEISTDWYSDEDLLDTLAYNLWTVVEEGMEMGGVVLFIHALLKYMHQEHGIRVNVSVKE